MSTVTETPVEVTPDPKPAKKAAPRKAAAKPAAAKKATAPKKGERPSEAAMRQVAADEKRAEADAQTAEFVADQAKSTESPAETVTGPKPRRQRKDVTAPAAKATRTPKAKKTPRPKIADMGPADALQTTIDRMGENTAPVFAELASILGKQRKDIQPVIESVLSEKSNQAFGLGICGLLSFLWREHRNVRVETADDRGKQLVETQKRS